MHKIQLSVRKPWEVSKGHPQHRSGAGTHTAKPRKGARGERHRQAIRDYS